MLIKQLIIIRNRYFININKPLSDVSFSKAILSGLLIGIIAAVLNIVYTIVYREITGFETAEIIMPLSIFIRFPILLTMGGYAYFLMQKHLPKGLNWFIFFVTALLAALLLITFLDTRRNGGALLSGLRGLSLGMEIITCLLAVFLIPYFATHPKIYE